MEPISPTFPLDQHFVHPEPKLPTPVAPQAGSTNGPAPRLPLLGCSSSPANSSNTDHQPQAAASSHLHPPPSLHSTSPLSPTNTARQDSARHELEDLKKGEQTCDGSSQQERKQGVAPDEDSLLRRREGMADAKDVSKGDEVSYQWGGGQPGGTVTDVATDGAVTMETKRGNEVKKKGDAENPAVYIQRDEGHDVVKKASEIQIDEKKGGASSSEDKKEEKNGEKEEEGEKKAEENGEAKTGEKRAAEDDAEAEDEDAKKQKTDEAQANGDKAAPKKKGRPAKGATNGTAKKETKKRAPKKAATESGEPRRSGRNASKSE